MGCFAQGGCSHASTALPLVTEKVAKYLHFPVVYSILDIVARLEKARIFHVYGRWICFERRLQNSEENADEKEINSDKRIGRSPGALSGNDLYRSQRERR